MRNKRSSILPKKLNELDHLVNKIFSVQPDNPSSLQRNEAEIEQSLTFVKNLLSAEMASYPAKQYYLEKMSERVREIEAAFRGFGTGSGTTTSTLDHVDNVGGDDDHASKCSCNKSSLQDEEEDDNGSDDLESTFGQYTGDCVDLVEQKNAMPVAVFNNALFEEKVGDDRVEDEFLDRVENAFHDRVEDVFDDMSHNGASVEDGKEEKEIGAGMDLKENEKKENGLGFGKLCGAVVSGFVIGMFSMALMMESLDYDGYEGHGHFLTPT